MAEGTVAVEELGTSSVEGFVAGSETTVVTEVDGKFMT